jgi:hypothetical protein
MCGWYVDKTGRLGCDGIGWLVIIGPMHTMQVEPKLCNLLRKNEKYCLSGISPINPNNINQGSPLFGEFVMWAFEGSQLPANGPF